MLAPEVVMVTAKKAEQHLDGDLLSVNVLLNNWARFMDGENN